MPFSKSRLFITTDVFEDNVWFVRTEYEKFARLKDVGGKAQIWLYPYKIERTLDTFTEALEYVEKKFGRYYYDTYYSKNSFT